ncbi:MAG: hypothetical protein OXC95_04110 [Dehalococcoidia bacterium]|nr:hypothetical protein [Dehalococcoidia bacterium]
MQVVGSANPIVPFIIGILVGIGFIVAGFYSGIIHLAFVGGGMILVVVLAWFLFQ